MISLAHITKIYNYKSGTEYKALSDISLEIHDGEMVAIVGKSGAGKTTLLHILACIDSYESGEYTIDNILVKKLSERQLARIRNEKIGMVMQDGRAWAAGFRPNTIIESVNGQPLTFEQFLRYRWVRNLEYQFTLILPNGLRTTLRAFWPLQYNRQ